MSKNHILVGELVTDRENSWEVCTEEGEILFISKKHCEMYASGHWSIPMWLAEKMGLT